MGNLTFNEDNVRHIIVKNIEEAKRKLYEEFNTGYLIVNERTVPHPILWGLISRDELEVSYVLRDVDTPRQKAAQAAQVTQAPSQAPTFSEPLNFLKNKKELLESISPKESKTEKRLNSQIDDISKSIKELKNQLSLAAKSGTVAGPAEHQTIKKIKGLLSDNEFTYSYIEELVQKVCDTFPISELDDEVRIEQKVLDWIGEDITVAKERVHRKPHVVIIIGPTGVGKTTTLVKMATIFLAEQRKKGRSADFCFITTDTMRVGAVEQLTKMGEILEKNVVKAQNNKDLKEVFMKYKDKVDTIFIDTAGYGPNDAEHIAMMKKILSVKGLYSDIYLAVSASTKARDLLNIMQNYEPFGYQSVIITKCDESQQLGNALSALHERHKEISFLTNGQNIMKTMVRADTAEILKKLEGFHVDEAHIDGTFGTLEEEDEDESDEGDENDKDDGEDD